MTDYETVLTKHGITHIHVVSATLEGKRWALMWDTPDAQFHVWFRHAYGDFKTLDTEMYKNNRRTRIGKVNLPMVDAVVAWAKAHDLIDKKLRELAEEHEKEQQKFAEAERLLRVHHAGPALLKALKAFVDAPGFTVELLEEAKAAIRQAEGNSG